MDSLPQPQIDWTRGAPSKPLPAEWKAWELTSLLLGYPADVPLERHVIGERERQFDILGIPIRPLPDDPERAPDFYTYGYRKHRDGPLLWVRAIAMRVPILNSNVFVERTYRADGTIREDICGVNTVKYTRVPYNRMMNDALKALTVLGVTFPERGPGRPLDSGAPVAPAAVAVQYWSWFDERGKRPSQEDLAPVFCLSVSQFKRRLKRLRETEHFIWPPPRPE